MDLDRRSLAVMRCRFKAESLIYLVQVQRKGAKEQRHEGGSRKCAGAAGSPNGDGGRFFECSSNLCASASLRLCVKILLQAVQGGEPATFNFKLSTP
jgi:hypothetical protein